ncbi:helix-turn-helix domain-containing protein [Pseudomonas corrugata]|uniref:helix-turn-helix domain-containing protein n=1 Tax=Pseudomonas corrugata TaxID=47879 RepID=UPI0022342AAE|nr:helix-turn-helix transcriptional regulator [Pseudomonas corrugata]UZE07665.1 helix-turn-helix domain-containing protein [Pseudomonas corrugata]
MHFSAEIGARLQAERKRLGLNQDQFCEAVGVSKRTQAAYEAGTTDPTTVYLSAAASKLGVDVLFVVTGLVTPRPVESLSIKEDRLVSQYRSLPEGDQQAVDRIVGAMWEVVVRKKE